MLYDPSLDDRLYRLQSNLPVLGDLRTIVTEADIAFLKGEEGKCNLLLEKIEHECTIRNISLPTWESIEKPHIL